MPEYTITTYEGTEISAETFGYTVQVVDGALAHDVPAGGTTGQRLVKASDDDYDLEWVDGSGGGSTVSVDADGTVTVDATTVELATDAQLAAEAALARNADNLTSGTVADARIASTIARDSEVATAQAAAEATAAAALAAHAADTTAIHGIADASDLILEGDSRLTDSRTPSGPAGGVLSGTYPNPGFAADMATQAELDAHVTDASDAHDASAISYAGSANLSATDVEGALDELDSEKAAASHTHAAADIASGTVAPARLGSGSGGSTKFLREDSTWQTVSAGGGAVSADTIWDAKGDLAVGTAADTAARLAVGSDFRFLVPDATQTTGLRWHKAHAKTMDRTPLAPNSMDDEFNDDTGMSGPSNGLNARWTKKNMGTAGWSVLDDTKAPDAFMFDIPTGQTSMQAIHQAAPGGDFALVVRVNFVAASDRQIWGLFCVDTNGTGVVAQFDEPSGDAAYIRPVTTWGTPGTGIATLVCPGQSNANTPWRAGQPMYLSLRKASGVYHSAAWFHPQLQPAGAGEVNGTPSAFTPAYVGFGRFYGTGTGKVLLDWFRKTA